MPNDPDIQPFLVVEGYKLGPNIHTLVDDEEARNAFRAELKSEHQQAIFDWWFEHLEGYMSPLRVRFTPQELTNVLPYMNLVKQLGKYDYQLRVIGERCRAAFAYKAKRDDNSLPLFDPASLPMIIGMNDDRLADGGYTPVLFWGYVDWPGVGQYEYQTLYVHLRDKPGPHYTEFGFGVNTSWFAPDTPEPGV